MHNNDTAFTDDMLDAMVAGYREDVGYDLGMFSSQRPTGTIREFLLLNTTIVADNGVVRRSLDGFWTCSRSASMLAKGRLSPFVSFFVPESRCAKDAFVGDQPAANSGTP